MVEKEIESVEKEKTEVEKKEIEFGIQLRLTNKKQEYIKNIINARYYLSRCNMMADQLLCKNIKEVIDGCLKTEDLMKTEYALMKMQAINSMRTAHFAKQDLFKDFKLTEKDINALEEDYYDGKIIREDYDESYKKKSKAEFINSSKD